MDKMNPQSAKQKYIIPSKYAISGDRVSKAKVCVVAHMHYCEDIDRHWEYIKNITPPIDVFITTSSDELIRKLQIKTKDYSNILIIKKKNRGRDISSLLVACRERILEYDYICFVHDKKEKKDCQKNDVLYLDDMLWQSMLATECYIKNVIRIFDANTMLGVLSPFPVIRGHLMTGVLDAWYGDYDNTQRLINDLSLDYLIDRKEQPVSLWTVFWARVGAIKPLLEREWKYEDFDKEPLAGDGTISHAVERSIGYVARANGFDTGWIISDTYAINDLEYREHFIKNAMGIFDEYIGIDTIYELDCFRDVLGELDRFAKAHTNIFIYGAGIYGQKCLKHLGLCGAFAKGFIMTNKDTEEVMGIPVYGIDELRADEKCGIIVAAGKKNREEILSTIQDYGIDADVYIFRPYGD